ncbi:hypothetical protein AB1Y20_003872 [Prymnesium parvum]|uniref:EngB-type G domain-containing protein n=1 Tax=Prymnesium parvum TaxID=97485 RepID=A0AB34J897_PRYPA
MLRLLRGLTRLTSLTGATALLSDAFSASGLSGILTRSVPQVRAPECLSAAGKRAVRRQRQKLSPSSPSPAAALAHPADGAGGAVAAASLMPATVSDLRRLAKGERRTAQLVELYDVGLSANLPPAACLDAVVAALLREAQHSPALELVRRHLRSHAAATPSAGVSKVFLALCRRGELEQASSLLAELDALPPPATGEAGEASVQLPAPAEAAGASGTREEALGVAVYSTLLPALARAHLAVGKSHEAAELMLRLVRSGGVVCPPIDKMTQLIREFGKSKNLGGVYACLDAMAAAKLAPDAENLQVMVDALVKDVRFVTGGVSMGTLPTDPLPEVAFVGRSNVGKSSLVNMVLGRRALAYTSKTPGKTQQYNYFLINEGRDEGVFHLVDMPGLGYAQADSKKRKEWVRFFGEYVRQRQQLRLFVHLIDGEIGLLDTDLEIMKLAAEVSKDECRWQYALILTKVDKRKGKAKANVYASVMDAVEKFGCDIGDRIIQTSARTKLGRADAWRLLRPVVLPSDRIETSFTDGEARPAE